MFALAISIQRDPLQKPKHVKKDWCEPGVLEQGRVENMLDSALQGYDKNKTLTY